MDGISGSFSGQLLRNVAIRNVAICHAFGVKSAGHILHTAPCQVSTMPVAPAVTEARVDEAGFLRQKMARRGEL